MGEVKEENGAAEANGVENGAENGSGEAKLSDDIAGYLDPELREKMEAILAYPNVVGQTIDKFAITRFKNLNAKHAKEALSELDRIAQSAPIEKISQFFANIIACHQQNQGKRILPAKKEKKHIFQTWSKVDQTRSSGRTMRPTLSRFKS